MLSRYKKLFLSLFFLSLYAGIVVFATPPGSQYTPGETLDPSCAPGSANCSVLITGGGAGTLDLVTTLGNTTSNTITVGNLIVSGNGSTVSPPSNASASIIYDPEGDDGVNYSNQNYTFTYRIYAYQDIGLDRIYSSSYTEATVTDNGNDDSQYGIQLSWNAAPSADGYRILIQDNYNGYDFDAGYDTSGTTLLDDGCNNICFNGGADADVTPTTSYTNTSSINGGLSVNGIFSLTGTTPYINFSNTTGSSGYGFRDNGGTLEWKNNAGSWAAFGGGSGWGLTGNAGTDADTNFIGTTDDVDFVIKRDNEIVARFAKLEESDQDYYSSVFLGLNAGNNANRAAASNFIGHEAGQNAQNANNSNFFGQKAGESATNANSSNFFGRQAGEFATSANNSNFFGLSAGISATNASNAIFIGRNAGSSDTVDNTTDTDDFSILLGPNTSTGGFSNSIALGGYATNTAENQLVIGSDTRKITSIRIGGRQGTASTDNTIFIGENAGRNATNASKSNFFGLYAGETATSAQFSNFFGVFAGGSAINAQHSNFFGNAAGEEAFNATHSNFFGRQAGHEATNANNSNFFGYYAGYNATDASYSNFFGEQAGVGATNASYSNLFGFSAGRSFDSNSDTIIDNNLGSNNIIIGTNISLPGATANAINLGGVLFGTGTYETTTGNPSISANTGGRIGILSVSPLATLDVNGDAILSGTDRYLNFGTTSGTSGYGFRDSAGILQYKNNTGSWTGITPPITSTNSSSLFSVELSAGIGSSASESNFFGVNAGDSATNASNSNFFGTFAGQNAFSANNSNFFGTRAGQNGTNASNSNFFGVRAGQNGTNASNSNFFGYYAGYQATSASNSNFIGNEAGSDAINASHSNLFGRKTGSSFPGNNIGSNNIIIGTNISLPDATANAINLGGVLFGTGTYSDIVTSPSITPVSGGRIGIGVVSPSYTLQVGNSGVSGIVARFQNSTGTCDINPTTTSLVCSSDATLKSNITSLDSSLTSLSALRPVTYSWNSDVTNAPQVGFIAQEVESIFPNLVFTDPLTGLKSLAYTNLIPYTVKAIQDINLSLKTLEDTSTSNPFRDALTKWFASAANGIESLFTKRVMTEELCVGTQESYVCLDKSQIESLLSEKEIAPTPVSGNNSSVTLPEEEVVETSVQIQEEENKEQDLLIDTNEI